MFDKNQLLVIRQLVIAGGKSEASGDQGLMAAAQSLQWINAAIWTLDNPSTDKTAVE